MSDLELKIFERYVGYQLFRKNDKASTVGLKPTQEPVKQVFTYQLRPKPSAFLKRLKLEIELVPFQGVDYDMYGRPKGSFKNGTDTNECKRMRAASKALKKERRGGS